MTALRIVADNLVDVTNSLTASTTSGSLTASNMKHESKGTVHRSTGTSVTYTMTWSANKKIGCLAIPAANLTASATIRGRLFSDEACTVQLVDSGTVTACPGLVVNVWGWNGAPVNVNAFAYGGAAKTALWFTSQPTNVRGAKIDLVDTGGIGYIDCARLIAGEYWEPAHNADYGVEVGIVDSTVTERNEAGDLMSDIAGTIHDYMALSLSAMREADRLALVPILNHVGTRRNFLLSLFPGSSPSALERNHMIYGRRSNAGIVLAGWDAFSNRIVMEGW